MSHSVLLIPVAELEPIVRPRLERRATGYLHVDSTHISAHITLLGPFVNLEQVDQVLIRHLKRFFSGVLPLAFTLRTLRSFPDGTAYLTPEPEAPFRALTQALWQAYPDFSPYGGAFDDVVPHLSLDDQSNEPAMSALACQLVPLLPLEVRVNVAHLYWYESGASRTLASFPLGGDTTENRTH